MEFSEQKAKATQFAALHRGPRILVLANAWDAASACILESAGFPAIATTSAGIANSLGRADGQHIGRYQMLEVVKRIAHVVSVPVTADMEAGYGGSPEDVADTARAVIEAGAVGMNLEDAPCAPSNSLFDVSLQVEKIKAIREVTASSGMDFVLNARTDVFLRAIGGPETRLDHAIRRANAYREEGANCIFVPGVTDRETIASLVKEIHAPLNILATAGAPPVSDLEKIGVARVSVGSGMMRAAMGFTQRIALDFLESGEYTNFTEPAISYAEMNQLFPKSGK